MSKLPSISGDEAIEAFMKLGFALDRQKGSHRVLKRSGHRFVLTVPDHKTLKAGTLRGLISAAGITVDDFVQLL